MTFSAPRKSFALSTALVGLGLIGFPVIAHAGTCNTPVSPNTVICSGAPDNVNDRTYTTTAGGTGTLVVNAGAGIDTTGSAGVRDEDALRVVAGGVPGGTWVSTISATASLTSNDNALVLSPLGSFDEDFVQTVDISGTLVGGANSGFDGAGILLLNQPRASGGAGGSSNISAVINVLAGGSVTGTTNAILSATSSDFSLTNAGTVTATSGMAVDVTASATETAPGSGTFVGGDILLNNSSTISGTTGGFIAEGNGAVSVTNSGSITTTDGAALGITISGNDGLDNGELRTIGNTGTITSTNGLAVDVSNDQAMDQLRVLTLNLGGTITGGAQLASSDGDAAVNVTGAINNDGDALTVSGDGNSDIEIGATGAITSTGGLGVVQTTSGAGGSDFSVLAGGTVAGSTGGVSLTNSGTGAVDIDMLGGGSSITSAAGTGLTFTDTAAGSGTTVDLADGSTVSGATGGLSGTILGDGTAVLNLNGAISATGAGATALTIGAGGSNDSVAITQASTGAVTSVARAVDVQNDAAASSTTVTLNGAVTSTGGVDPAIEVGTSGTAGALNLTLNGATSGTAATLVRVDNDGTGAASVTLGSSFTASTPGTILDIDGAAGSAGVTVDVQAGAAIASGASNVDAIDIDADGAGIVDVDIARSVSSAVGDGLDILAGAAVTGVDVDIAAAGSVTGATLGINVVHNGTGNAAIDVAGTAGDILLTTGATAGDARVGSTGGAGTIGATTVSHAGTGSATVDLDKTTAAGPIRVTTTAGTTATITSESSINTSTGTGISLTHGGSGLASVTSNGPVTATAGRAISATTSGAGLTIVTGAGGAVSGSSFGIEAMNNGTGATSITNNGTVTSTGSLAISAFGAATSSTLTIGVNAAVNGSTGGITANNSGTGLASVALAGSVTTTGGIGVNLITGTGNTGGAQITSTAAGAVNAGDRGLFIQNQGSGSATIDIDGAVTSTGSSAISITNFSGSNNATVIADGVVTASSNGIGVTNQGSGFTSITANNTINAGTGIVASGLGTNMSVTTGVNGDINATNTAIGLTNLGSGTTTIDLDGDAISTGLSGITSLSTSSATTISSTTDGAVSSGAAGTALKLETQSATNGGVVATANGAVTGGTGGGIDIDVVHGDVQLTTGAGGTVTASADAINITQTGAGGAITATLNGTVQSTAEDGVDITSTGTGAITLTANAGVSTSGTTTAEQAIAITQQGTGQTTVTTNALVSGGQGISVANNGTGATGVSINNTAAVTGTAGHAIVVASDASSGTVTGLIDIDIDAAVSGGGTQDAVSVTNAADSAQNITLTSDGAVQATGTGAAISLQQSAISTGALTVTTNAGGTITSGTGTALVTDNLGSGLTDVTLADAVTSGGIGVSMKSAAGGITFDNTAAGTINAVLDGIQAINATASAGSAFDIDIVGAVTSTTAAGIVTQNNSALTDIDVNAAISAATDGISATATDGAIQIDTTALGTVAGGNTNAGIRGATTRGDLTITTLGTIGAGSGIVATTADSGNIDIDVQAAITGVNAASSAGISAANSATNGSLEITNTAAGTISGFTKGIVGSVAGGTGTATVNLAGAVTGIEDGVELTLNNDGGLDFDASAAITGGSGDGLEVVATSSLGLLDIDLTAAGNVSGADGVVLQGGPEVDLDFASTITATGGDGIRVTRRIAGEAVNINGAAGSAINATTGDGILVGDVADLAQSNFGAITVDMTGTIDADADGIDIGQAGNGDVAVTQRGSLSGDEDGIEVSVAGSGNILVTTTGTVAAAERGIAANTTGAGNVTLDIDAAVTANGTANGVVADSTGAGNVRVELDAAVTGVTAATGVALSNSSGGTLTFVGGVAADVTADANGMTATNTAGTDTLIDTDGDITGDIGLTVATSAAGATTGGNTTLDLGGAVTGRTGDAIDVTAAAGGALSITIASAVTAADDGVSAVNNGDTTSNITLTNTGSINAVDAGIELDHAGTGLARIDVDGAVTRTGFVDNPYAIDLGVTSGTLATIDVTANVTSNLDGILLTHAGSGLGSVELSNGAALSANGGQGINARSTTSALMITTATGTSVTSSEAAVDALHSGSGLLTVDLNGTATSTGSETAITLVQNGAGGTGIDADIDGTVQGFVDGVSITSSAGGVIDLDVTATVTGGTDGIAVASNGAAAIDVNTSAQVTGSGGDGINITSDGSGATVLADINAGVAGAGANTGIEIVNSATGSTGVTVLLDGAVTMAGAASGSEGVLVTQSGGAVGSAVVVNTGVAGTISDAFSGIVVDTGVGTTVDVDVAGAIALAAAGTDGDGILIDHDGTGAITLDTVSTGTITVAGSADGIEVDSNSGVATTLNIGGAVDAGANGIDVDVDAGANGALSLTTTAGVIARGGVGVVANQDGTGASTLTLASIEASTAGVAFTQTNALNTATQQLILNGDITGVGGTGNRTSGIGVSTENAGEGITNVELRAAIESTGTGLRINDTAETDSIVTVTAAGSIDSSALGIDIDNAQGDVTLTTSGSVLGGTGGIDVDQLGGNVLTVTTNASVTATAGNGIDLVASAAPLNLDVNDAVTANGAGGIGINATASGIVTADISGNVSSSGDAINLTSTTPVSMIRAGNDIDVSGTVLSTAGRGLVVSANTTFSDVDISGSITSALDGVRINSLNEGVLLDTTAAGDILTTGTGIGVNLSTGTGFIGLTLNGSIEGTIGILASGGDTNITTNDTVTGNTGNGIGTIAGGTLTIDANAAVTGATNGIIGSGVGTVTVTTDGAVDGNGGDGINIAGSGVGHTVSVTTNSTVEGSDDGLQIGNAAADAGNYVVAINDSVTGTAGSGATILHAGSGTVDIDIDGAVSAGTTGIAVETTNALIDIDTTTSGTITSGGAGISALVTGTGSADVLTGGAIDASGDGVRVTNRANSTTTFRNTALVEADQQAIVLLGDAGANTALAATLDGQVAGGTGGIAMSTNDANIVLNVNAQASTISGDVINLANTDTGSIVANIDAAVIAAAGSSSNDGLVVSGNDLIDINVDATIDVFDTGIDVTQTGNSGVDLDIDGNVAGRNVAAATVTNNGTGLTNLDVATSFTMTGATGVTLGNGAAGSGAKNVRVAGSIQGTAGDGLVLTGTATGTSSTVNVVAGGSVTGTARGLAVTEVGAPVDIDVAGTVTGGTTAIDVNGTGTTTDIDFASGAVVTGTGTGLNVVTGTATAVTVDILSGATVTGTNTNALAFELNGTSTLVLNIDGVARGAQGLVLSGTSAQRMVIDVDGTLEGTGGTAIDAGGLLLGLTVDGDVIGDVIGGAPGSQITFTSGEIDGDVTLGAGVDTLDLGQVDVTGNVSTGAGNDSVVMSDGTRQLGTGGGGGTNLDLGADDDLLEVRGAGGQFDDVNRDGILDVRQGVGGSNAPLFTASGGTGNDVMILSNADTSAEAFEGFTEFETLRLVGTTFDGLQIGGTGRTLNFENLIIESGSTYLGDGNSPLRTEIVGDVTNGGVGIDLRDQTGGVIDATTGDGDDSVIIGGDFIANGGQLLLDVALDATAEGAVDRAGTPDGPDADFIAIGGDVSGGATTIVINDIGNGTGALTGTDGIVLVEVDGTVTANDFVLSGGAVSTPGFLYTLDFVDGGAGTSQFVLRSEVSGAGMQFPVVATAAFGFGADMLGTMSQRSASRQGYGAGTGLGQVQALSFAEAQRGAAGGSWIRFVAVDGNSDGDITGLPVTAEFDHQRTALQVGYDFELSRTATSVTMGSVSGHLGRITQDASGAGGALRADGDANAFGIGFGATYTTNTGFYLDSGISVTSLDYDFETAGAGRGSTDGTTIAAKVEVGQRYEMTGYTLIPQAQLTVGRTSIDDFTDSAGVTVDFDDGNFAEARLGVRAEFDQANGGLLYGGVDVISDLSGEVDTTVAGTALTYEEEGASVKVTGGFRSGPEGAASSFFGEFGYEDGPDRSETSVTGGVSLRF